MNSDEVREILAAYRPGSADREDPFFAEALRAVEQDAGLAAWFAEQQKLDAVVAGKLRALPAPGDLREKILQGARLQILPSPPRERSVSRAFLAWAAVLVVALGLGTVWGLRLRTPGPALALAFQAIAYSQQMPPVQFVCYNAKAVKSWVAERPSAQALGVRLEKTVPNMGMFGGSTTQWQGKPVVMLVLQNHEQMGYLYLLRASDFDLGNAPDMIAQREGWVAKVHREGGLAWVLVTRGGREKLNFDLPL